MLKGLTDKNILQIAGADLPFISLTLLRVIPISIILQIVSYLPDTMSNR